MKITLVQLRETICYVINESPGRRTRSIPMPDGYRYGDEESLMMDKEGMEKSDLENVKKYLSAMGILKV